jgi:hypothetical protein
MRRVFVAKPLISVAKASSAAGCAEMAQPVYLARTDRGLAGGGRGGSMAGSNPV